jgi:hypothetical protein
LVGDKIYLIGGDEEKGATEDLYVLHTSEYQLTLDSRLIIIRNNRLATSQNNR